MVNPPFNLATITTKGGDLGARYEFDGPFDTFVSADLTATYIKSPRTVSIPGAGEC